MNPNILEVVNFDETIKKNSQGSRLPEMMEFQVNPDLAPYLVSSTRSVLWVDHASKSNMIRAAVRKRQGLQKEMIAAVADAGTRSEWGNVHPLTDEGLQACVDHLIYYELESIEVLVNPDTDLEGLDFGERTPIEAPWMPQDAVVFVPADRSFVGMMGTMGQHKALALIHNASRGIAVAHR